MSLPSHLVERCRQILLQCSQFDSYDSLQSFLVTTELRMHRRRVPRCNNRADQVDQTIAYLWQLKLMNGEPTFPIFLLRLRDRQDKNGPLYRELDDLHKQVLQVASNNITLPFVTVSMTKQELNELMTEKIFNDPTVPPVTQFRFRQFRRVLSKMGISDLSPYYGAHREEWKPLIYPHTSIKQIVTDMMNRVNHYLREPQQLPKLYPQFLSNDFFTENRKKRIQTLRKLRQSGGIIIVDSISLFHPILAQILSSSDLGSNKRVAILVVSPINTNTLPINQLIEQTVDSYMQMTSVRFEEDFDKLCELGVGDLRTLRRWLYDILPETAKIAQSQRPNFDNSHKMRQMMGTNPRGIQQAFWGGGER
ncbi:MAG: hypothetical protein ACPGWR_14065 [Ardenticatenaceae bacterium]